MTKARCGFIVLFLLFTAAGCVRPLQWRYYQVPEGRYKVQMPHFPLRSAASAAIGDETFLYQTKLGNKTFQACAFTYNAPPADSDELQILKSKILKNSALRLFQESNLELQGYRGKQLIMKETDQGVDKSILTRIYLTGVKTGIRLTVLDEKGNPLTDRDSQRFLNSMRFDKPFDKTVNAEIGGI